MQSLFYSSRKKLLLQPTNMVKSIRTLRQSIENVFENAFCSRSASHRRKRILDERQLVWLRPVCANVTKTHQKNAKSIFIFVTIFEHQQNLCISYKIVWNHQKRRKNYNIILSCRKSTQHLDEYSIDDWIRTHNDKYDKMCDGLNSIQNYTWLL